MLENVLENCELKWLQNNYSAVETINKQYSISSIKNYTLKDWKTNIKSISFSYNSKLSESAIKTIIINLDNLQEINLNVYDCFYDISLKEYKILKENSIDVIFNKGMKYSEYEINKIINKEKYDNLMLKKEDLLNQLEYVESAIADLCEK